MGEGGGSRALKTFKRFWLYWKHYILVSDEDHDDDENDYEYTPKVLYIY